VCTYHHSLDSGTLIDNRIRVLHSTFQTASTPLQAFKGTQTRTAPGSGQNIPQKQNYRWNS
jgi:hypothetical protein